jgi:predicted O-methyltransferase YrrM
MPTLNGIMSRLTGRPRLVKPTPPIQTDNHFPTFAFSVDTQAPVPTRLVNLTLDAVRAVMTDISLDDLAKRKDAPDWFLTWPGEHYRLLAAFVQKLQPQLVIEIGTDTGLSSLAMKKYLPPTGRLITYDVRPWKTVEEHVLEDADFADGRLEQRLVDLSDPEQARKNRDVLEAADFFFIDAPKDNVFEYRLMERFNELNLKPGAVMLFDDTKLGSMLKFWHELRHPKLDITSFGHWSGSGLVEWSKT